jgi:hypothetical protein
MSTILNKAANVAHQATLSQIDDTQRYSQFPVHESIFWDHIFAAAKVRKTAQAVLDEMEEIEAEPCINNDRVWRNVLQARSFARLALLN